VVEAGSHWFWATSEHSIRALNKFSGNYQGCQFALHAPADRSAEGIQFSFPDRERAFLTSEDVRGVMSEGGFTLEEKRFLNEQTQLDVAFVHLDEFYADQLKVAGVSPFKAEDVWQNYHESAYSRLSETGGVAFFFAGVPASSIRLAASGVPESWTYKFLPIMFDSVEEPTILFRPMWESLAHEGSVLGMSGGPVVGVSFSSQAVYWFGVQSRELSLFGSLEKLRVAPATFAYQVMRNMVGLEDEEELRLD